MADQEPRGVVDGAFRVLRALPEAGPEHQVVRLAHLTGLPRPTVYRLLSQLHQSGVTWSLSVQRTSARSAAAAFSSWRHD